MFTFSCTHDAITGEKVLEENGIEVRAMALPDQIGAGCGICVRVNEEDGKRTEEQLLQAKIRPAGVYLALRGPDGMKYTPL